MLLKTTFVGVMLSLSPFVQCLDLIDDDGTACTMVFVYGVSAEVTDAQTGVPITNATLTLRDGTHIEVMEHFPTGDYVGAGEREGTYTLTATASGYQSVTFENIVVQSDPCHVIPVTVQVRMQPAE
ncbi:MAG TPA: carboxypeptidase regulatory-like domain-containing protein [Phycisphaerae bacterium]|nr:carboxypeptidase regulatory-like domain-containing protein [Phycisphaerae bacterium]